ncbi:uncharacterized protein LOC135005769 [Pseudophryne corroboree]|uniref:uncharacterized protein LOC135005769 n=1 Tax=Pseudophryne corroboree TaxID=495146 RepID=UPI0030813C68
MQVREVLRRLRENRLYGKLSKCTFEVPSIPFLGYVISGSYLQMDPTKLEAIANWSTPSTLKSIQRFLGFANYYRKFNRGFSTLIAPITNLTRKGADHSNWSEDDLAAFQRVKQAFMSAPVLSQPDINKPFELEVDAST